VKDRVDEVMGDLQTLQKNRRRAQLGHAMRDEAGGATSSSTRSALPADPACPPEPLDASIRCTSSTPPARRPKPKGILHTTGGYLTGVSATHRYVFDLQPESDVYWCAADVGWVTGHSYIVYGPARQRRDVRDVGGRARLPPTRASGGRSSSVTA